jgi:hypothetical protein
MISLKKGKNTEKKEEKNQSRDALDDKKNEENSESRDALDEKKNADENIEDDKKILNSLDGTAKGFETQKYGKKKIDTIKSSLKGGVKFPAKSKGEGEEKKALD